MSNFKILRVCAGDTNLASDFYHKEHLSDLHYEAQLRKFQSENFTVPGSWSDCMCELGNQATDVLINCDLIQRRWCEENGVRVDFKHRDWMVQVLRAQIQFFMPDVLFFYGGGFSMVRRSIREDLRQEFPFLKIISGLWGDELWENQYKRKFGDLDVVFTSTMAYKKFFDLADIPAHAVGSCFDHRLGERVMQQPVSDPLYDFVFTGSTGYGCPDHIQRYLDMIEMMRRTNLHIWYREPDIIKPTPTQRLKSYIKQPIKQVAMGMFTLLTIRQLTYLLEHTFGEGRIAYVIYSARSRKSGIPRREDFFSQRPKISDLFPDRSHPLLLTGSEYYDHMRRSKLVFNRHRDEVADYGNIRVFEATGLGACLITDRGSALREFFLPDEEIVTYVTIDECVEKVKYLLDHDSERREIAAKGQRRTLSEHTVMHQCIKINDILGKTL